MLLKIKRNEEIKEYSVENKNMTLLEALKQIKENIDPTLAFSWGCRSGVCGSCAVIVNGKEVLACECKVKEGDLVEPLKNVEVIKDLVANHDRALGKNKLAKAFLETYNNADLTNEDESLNELQSDCILCSSCYSACPVFSVNEDFIGPFALTRVWKYVVDKRECEFKSKIDTIQTNGVWDCTLCNECTIVCPQGISPKQDIEKLRAKSTQFGYIDPNFGSFGGFGNNFGLNF